jgi:hypothetical protein
MKTKAKYHFSDFVRPDGFWPTPYTVDQAFGVLAWMAAGATDNILALLSCRPSCTGFTNIEPVHSISDLQRRFHFALLSSVVGYYSPRAVSDWREKNGVLFGGSRLISFVHGDNPECEALAKERLARLFKWNKTLTTQLNSSHAEAVETYGVRMRLCGRCWMFSLEYGFNGSTWQHELARQKQTEPLWAATQRAEANVVQLCK